MFEVRKRFRFEAAHSLPHLPDGHKCKRLHGHSYAVDVCVRGELDDRGFVVDYAEISAATDPIIQRLDHQNINDLLDCLSTAENLARWIYEELRSTGLPVAQVMVYETPTTCCVYPI
ncbi:MAG: 6-carboxy-5,6,7,8-tetrahydropterin synthase [Anaerolineae bacterium]|nr:MAG: 6-carboxy-5,6,7,8-tetrahydropterin synthase [Anaerolineae bacterium]